MNYNDSVFNQQSVPLGFLYNSIFGNTQQNTPENTTIGFGDILKGAKAFGQVSTLGSTSRGILTANNAANTANSLNSQGFLQNMLNKIGLTQANLGALENLGGAAMGLLNIYGGLKDLRQNDKKFKSDMENIRLSREIAQNQLNVARQEYARLQNQRKGITSAYGGM